MKTRILLMLSALLLLVTGATAQVLYNNCPLGDPNFTCGIQSASCTADPIDCGDANFLCTDLVYCYPYTNPENGGNCYIAICGGGTPISYRTQKKAPALKPKKAILPYTPLRPYSRAT